MRLFFVLDKVSHQLHFPITFILFFFVFVLSIVILGCSAAPIDVDQAQFDSENIKIEAEGGLPGDEEFEQENTAAPAVIMTEEPMSARCKAMQLAGGPSISVPGEGSIDEECARRPSANPSQIDPNDSINSKVDQEHPENDQEYRQIADLNKLGSTLEEIMDILVKQVKRPRKVSAKGKNRRNRRTTRSTSPTTTMTTVAAAIIDEDTDVGDSELLPVREAFDDPISAIQTIFSGDDGIDEVASFDVRHVQQIEQQKRQQQPHKSSIRRRNKQQHLGMSHTVGV